MSGFEEQWEAQTRGVRYRLKRRIVYPFFWWYRDVRSWWLQNRDPVAYEASDLYSYALDWLIPRLRALREHGHSYPWLPVYDESGELVYGPHGPKNAMTPESWDAIIDEMIEGFTLALDDDDWSDEALEKRQRAAELLGQWFYHLWC